jgi:hypothetical protein
MCWAALRLVNTENRLSTPSLADGSGLHLGWSKDLGPPSVGEIPRKFACTLEKLVSGLSVDKQACSEIKG